MKVPAFALALATAVVMVPGPSPDAAPRVVPNDNRVAAGTQVRDTLHLSLVLQRAEWYPEAEDGPHVTVEAFSEAGKAPSIPAPLIRVREGTIIHATVRNALPDSTANLIGFAPHPIAAIDTIKVKPGDSTVVTFRAGAPGTYLYRAVIGNDPDTREAEHETAGGAFVVDPVGGDRFTDSLRSLAVGGRLLVIGFTGGEIPTVKVNRLLLNNVDVVGAGWGAWTFSHPGYLQEQWAELQPLLASGEVAAPQPEVFPLEQAAAAIASLENRSAKGKVVLKLR